MSCEADRLAPPAGPVPACVIETKRLILRRLSPEDAAFILELLNDPSFVRFIGDKGVRSLTDARAYLAEGPIDSYGRLGFGFYAVCQRDGTVTGMCGLVKRDALDDVDIGFAFLARYRSRGYATESGAAVLTYARQALHLGRVVAISAPENRGSIAVLGKIGLKFERTIRLAPGGEELALFASGPAAPP